ncbi:MAG: DUF6968 family protein [Saprospiraceae bacterium]
MENVIASREFDIHNMDDQEIGIIQILIFKPEEDSEQGGDWVCQYKVVQPDQVKISKAYGVDSIQAFLNAIKKIESELLHFQKSHACKIRWLGLNTLGLSTDLDIYK